MAQQLNESTKKIWMFLYDKIGNPYGVAGLMGNLFAESAMNPKNLQRSYEKKLGYTDDAYTKAVDSGKYKHFGEDMAGYGIAQWTSKGRKQRMLQACKKAGVSIGSLDFQLDFLWKELNYKTYEKVRDGLKNAKSVREASDLVLKKFEVPKDQSEKVQIKRANYGDFYYFGYKYLWEEEKEEAPVEKQDVISQLRLDEYGTPDPIIIDKLIDSAPKTQFVKVLGKSVWVRTKPSILSARVCVVFAGRMFGYVSTSPDGKWYLINYNGINRWITTKYTQIVEM